MSKQSKLTFAALFAALIFVATFFLKIPLPGTGYVHLGDGFIYIAACMLPFPYGVAAAAVGAGLADLLGGYAVYVLPTMVIKSLMTLLFMSSRRRILTVRNVAASFGAGLIDMAGYLLVDWFILGTWAALAAELPGLTMKRGVAIAVFLAAGAVLDKLEFKKKLGLVPKD